MNKFLNGLFYFILGVFGGLLGLRLALYFKASHPFMQENVRVFVGLGILFGLILTPLCVKLFLLGADWVIKGLLKLSFQELVLGTIGLVFGLIISTLMNVSVAFMPFESIPVVGEYLKPFLIVIFTIFWCYLGIFLSTRVGFIQNFGRIFGARGTWLVSGKIYKVLDTSAIIDGRIVDICKSGFLEGAIIVPQFILDEIQKLADSEDNLKRARGRKALEILHNLQKDLGIQIFQKDYPGLPTDTKLIRLSQDLKATLLTVDFNLNQIAKLQNIKVLNVNELANALKPIVLPGEEMKVHIVKEGKEPTQGVAYLDDGTMIVIEDGRRFVGRDMSVEVTSVIQTVAGRMIFTKIIRNFR